MGRSGAAQNDEPQPVGGDYDRLGDVDIAAV